MTKNSPKSLDASVPMAATLAAITILALISTNALANTRKRPAPAAPAIRQTETAYGVSGCGLGSLAFKEQKDSKVMQVLAATVNGTSGNQTFGISTGSLNCEIDGTLAARYSQQDMFVAANYEQLTKEAAVGEGESLAALAELLGCGKDKAQDLGTLTRAHYSTIFTGTNAMEPKTVVTNVKAAVAQDVNLADQCTLATL